MASVWLEADGVALRRALRLVDAQARWCVAASGPLTALEDRLGLSPLARRRLQWEVDRAAAPLAPEVVPSSPAIRASAITDVSRGHARPLHAHAECWRWVMRPCTNRNAGRAGRKDHQ